MGTFDARCHFGENGLGDALRIVSDVAVPEPNHSPAELLQKRGPGLILVGGCEMLAAVELDRKLRFAAGEVEDVISDNQLPREARPMVPDKVPDLTLLRGCPVAQVTRELRQMWRNPRHRVRLHLGS